ncbi:unnamed protein product [Ambrosiozyma monospora]|uniref:Unnamed protein product n=1 Tax=Ambrosiozyma monospora TaxID=43982 RepID=A0A9W6SUJ3_AMBMO|nr:unnamed protein product [Ambrosiozyma monospora]
MAFRENTVSYGSISSLSTTAESISTLESSSSSSSLIPLKSPKQTATQIEYHEIPYIDLDNDNHDQETNKSLRYKIISFLWDGQNKHPKERAFLLKLDFFLLSSAMLGYFIKSLNQSNISTAYMNGMKSYYGMNHNEYNYMLSSFTVGYILGAFPANYFLHKINVRVYLGFLEIVWGILTLVMVSIGPTQIHLIYLIRFIVGLMEAAFFPTVTYIIGSWYTPDEMTKRTSIFSVASSFAGILSGPLQELLLKVFHDAPLKPFKCMFVVDAIISIPIGVYTLYANPNTPSTTDAWYFTDDDKLIGLERQRRCQALARSKNQINSTTSKNSSNYNDLFKTWHIYIFPLLFLCYNHSLWCIEQPSFQTWMKYDLKLPSSSYNFYPSLMSAINMVVALSTAFANDYFGKGQSNHYFILTINQ